MLIFEQLIKDVPLFFQLIGQKVPTWVWYIVGIFALGYLALSSITYIMSFVKNLKDQLTQLRDPEQKQRRVNRQTFAEHIEQEIRRLSLKEDWKDKRFAELEAEVEVDGQMHFLGFTPFTYFFNRTKSSLTKSGTRREKSVSKALSRSKDRLILVEGEPGSGKSVALRHVVQSMAEAAKKSRSTKSIIPIYLNLKELNRPDETTIIDRNLIETFILKSLKRINDRDVDSFLDEEFHIGMKNGTWFFLFDSFDELPEILSSTESDAAIKSYGDAIADFLQGMNRCRGVVASRHFNGPKYFDWSRFTIQPLSEKRRLQLIRKSDLSTKLVGDFIGELGNARAEITLMASNPLFLSLLCEHMKSGHSFPLNAHTVFETYVGNRLKRDYTRLEQRFKIDTIQIRRAAESIAFCMAADAGLGLNPTRERLQQALESSNMTIGENFATVLDALEFIKLARSEESLLPVQSRSFTFAHRRFQEYFATCVVLHEPSLVSPQQLLTNARWRETAVVMFQTQPIDKLRLLLDEAALQLDSFCNGVSNLINDPLEYIEKEENKQAQLLPEGFPWSNGLHHLLGLLQDGFINHLADLPAHISVVVGKLLLTATEFHMLDDRKYALEVAGTTPEPILTYLLKGAFASKSQWLKEVAYRQVASVSFVTPDVAKGIRTTLLGLTTNRRIYREKYAVKAYISRLRQPYAKNFLSILKLLLRLPAIDFFWHVILLFCFIIIFSSFGLPNSISAFIFFIAFIAVIFSYLFGQLYIFTSRFWKFACFFIVVEMRVVGLFLLLLTTYFLSKSNHTSSMLLIFLSINVFLLVPIALLAAKLGSFTSWSLWFFVPFYPSIWPFMTLYTKRSKILSSFSKGTNIIDSFKFLFRITTFSFIILLLFLIYIFATVFRNVSNVVITILSIAMFFAIVYYIILDVVCWHRWMMISQHITNCEELLKVISKYKIIDSYKVKTLVIIRERKLLQATIVNQEILKDILFKIEAYIKEKDARKSNFSTLKVRAAQRKKIGQDKVVDKIIRGANAQFLDELYKLRESLLHVSES